MINKAAIKNFGALKNINWDNLSKINLIIGENSSGKSFLLKSLYTAIRTIEEYKRGDDRRSESEILIEKLHWTFQTEKIGDLVNKASDDLLSCEITHNDKEFQYRFGKDTARNIQSLTNRTSPRDSNSIYLPSKEVRKCCLSTTLYWNQEKKINFLALMILTWILFVLFPYHVKVERILRNLPTHEKL